ncbi:hypothetical protein DPMN_156215 [Dreissena polymorpha]|uniref:Uncharacterized protein n=1 Tax=Dreissena polymorpha TaxID=45954 RepID=A0A9D4JC45_DREPO|nr:hypothetical protein DPMN_156215 [Dreissena polymorpha]
MAFLGRERWLPSCSKGIWSGWIHKGGICRSAVRGYGLVGLRGDMALLGRDGGCRPAVRGYGLAELRGRGIVVLQSWPGWVERGGGWGAVLQSKLRVSGGITGDDFLSSSQGIWPG